MRTFDENNPNLKEYFESLPIHVKNQIIDSKIEISSFNELTQIAEHFMKESTQSQS